MSTHPSRRQILRSASLGLVIGYPHLTYAQSAAPTPQCHDGDEATIRQTEGPYFKPSSPQRADLVEPDTRARLVEINARAVRSTERLSTSGMPMSTGNTTTPASAIADTSLPMGRVATTSAPSCPRSIPAAPVTITLECRLRNDRCSRRSSIFPMSRLTGAMAYSGATW